MGQRALRNGSIFEASNRLMYFHENNTGTLKLVDDSPENDTAVAFDAIGDLAEGKILKYRKKYSTDFQKIKQPY